MHARGEHSLNSSQVKIALIIKLYLWFRNYICNLGWFHLLFKVSFFLLLLFLSFFSFFNICIVPFFPSIGFNFWGTRKIAYTGANFHLKIYLPRKQESSIEIDRSSIPFRTLQWQSSSMWSVRIDKSIILEGCKMIMKSKHRNNSYNKRKHNVWKKEEESWLPTCNFGTRVAPPINSTAYISSIFKPECFNSSFTGKRDFSHKSPHNSSNFSRVMVLLK